MYKSLILLLMLSCFLCGCTSTEEVEEVPMQPLTEISDSYTYGDIKVNAIGTHCGFSETDEGFEIFPYNNCSKHITVKRILLSENHFWENLLESEEADSIVFRYKSCSYFTTTEGVTYGYYEVGDYGYIFSTFDLPSSYVKAVLSKTCVLDS